jgi:hypothetical protein
VHLQGRKLALGWLTTAALALGATCAEAQTVIGFDAPAISLQAGERRLVPVYATGVPANGLAAFQWVARFDPQVVRLHNPNEAARGTVPVFAPLGSTPACAGLRGGTCSDPPWMMTSTSRQPFAGPDVIDNVLGRVRVVYGTTGTQAPPAGAGVIALLEVEAAQPGSTNITFEAIVLSDRAQPPQRLPATSATLGVNVTTIGGNNAPILATIGPQSVPEGSAQTVTASATDADGHAITLSASGLPAFATFIDDGGGSGRLILAPGFTNAGVYSVSIVARDAGTPSLSDSERVDITVPNVNRAPVVATIPNASGAEAAPLSIAVSASDPDGNALSYSATGLPAGVSIHSGTGVISGMPAYTAAGAHPITVSVTDGVATTSVGFTLTIANTNRAPLVNSPGSQSFAEGQSVAVQIVANDPDGSTLSYSASGLPPGLSIDPGSGLITGTLPFDAAGVYTSLISASDGTDTTNRNLAWAIANTNRGPVIASPGNQEHNEGAIIALQLVANDADGEPLTWSGSGFPPDLTLSSSGLISGTLSYDSVSPYTFTVSVTDGDLSDSATLNWTVIDRSRPPEVNFISDRTFQENEFVFIQASAFDPEGDPITWSATGLPTSITMNATNGRITGLLNFTSAGEYPVTVSAHDGTSAGTMSFILHVDNSNRDPVVTQPPDRTSEVGQSASFPIVATDPDGDDLVEYVAFDLPPGFSIDPGTGVISGTAPEGSEGTYFPWVEVWDELEGVGGASFMWRVFPPGGTPQMLDIRINNSSDDAEENATTGAMSLTNDDLELGNNGATVQFVGMRWRNVTIPRDATILSAHIQFRVDETNFDETFVNFTGQLHENAPVFASTAFNISTRIPTLESVEWEPFEWGTVGQEGFDQRTPDLTAIVQEIIEQPNWRSNNSLVMMVSGSGERTAESFNGLAAGAPLLHVEYVPASNQSPAVPTPAAQTHAENANVDLLISAFDPESQPLTCTATGLPGGLVMGASTCRITGRVAWGAVGSFTAEVTVSDGNASTAVSFPWTVTARTNTAPSVLSPGDQGHMTGGTANITVRGTDPESDPLTYSATGLPAGLTINPATGVISGTVGSSAACTCAVALTATDGQLTATTNITWRVFATSGTARAAEVRVVASNEDAEERVSNGAMTLNSDDLELISDGANAQRVGVRFRNMNIPRNSVINRAWLQFQVDEASTAAASVTIQAQTNDNGAVFTTSTNNINSRTKTTQSVAWTIPAWPTVGASGADQRSPDISAVIQPVVNRTGWAANNAIVLFLTGSGSRIAEAFDGLAAGAPILHIEYTPP